MSDTEGHGDAEALQKFTNRGWGIILKSILDLLAIFNWLIELSFEGDDIDDKKDEHLCHKNHYFVFIQ